MAENKVAKFRRVFERELASGKYEPIDVVQAVKALATGAELVQSLDVYCTLFDPAKPQKSRNTFELCRTTGFNLFVRAIDLSDAQNELLEMLRLLADAQAAPLKDKKLAKGVPVYRTRYAALDKKDQDDIQRRVKKIVDDRAKVAATQRFLLDDLARAFQNQKGHAPKGDDLAWFDPGPATARAEFERLATACEAAWFPKGKRVAGVWVAGQFVHTPGAQPQAQKSSAAAMQNVHTAFAAFGAHVEAQLNQPLDLFRLLAWASEPENPYLQLRVRHAPNVPVALRAWSGVWQELYQDIAVRGVYAAVHRWKIDRMIQARGYVGKDLEFILAPLKAHGKDLLKRRLADYFKAAKAFAEAQAGRRKAKVWGDMKGLEIVDELESESHLKDMIKQFEADPKDVLARKVRIVSSRVVMQAKYSLYETVPGVFTVVWIPKGTGMSVAYVEVHAIPGIVFKGWGDRVGLEELIEDKMYADLAANAAALAQFLLFYLQVLGYVLDVITAGASGGLRVFVLRFIEERIKDKIVAEGLELAGIDNPWVQTLAGLATGFVPSAIKAPKVGAVKGLDQIEREAQNVMRSGSGFKPQAGAGDIAVAPKVQPGAPEPPKAAPPKPPVPSVGPRTEMVGDNLFVVEKASASEVAAHAAQAARGTAPKAPGPLVRAKDYVLDAADRATERMTSPAAAPALAGHADTEAGRAAAGLLATSLTRKGSSPGVGGAGGGPAPKITQRATRAVARLEKSSDYKLLLEYESNVMASWEKIESQKARRAIVNALERSGGGAAAEKEAIGQLRYALNKAKGEAGEFELTADLHSTFDVDDIVTVPTRGDGPPVLDVVVRLKKKSKLNGGKKFAFGEGKGGLRTALGEVTPKRYSFVNGELRFVTLRKEAIRQASGDWYYQKFAEIFIIGQKVGGATGKKMQALANELFEAARNGEIAAVVGKSNVKFDRKFIDSTEEVVAYFTKQKTWNFSGGFPVAK